MILTPVSLVNVLKTCFWNGNRKARTGSQRPCPDLLTGPSFPPFLSLRPAFSGQGARRILTSRTAFRERAGSRFRVPQSPGIFFETEGKILPFPLFFSAVSASGQKPPVVPGKYSSSRRIRCLSGSCLPRMMERSISAAMSPALSISLKAVVIW